LQHRVRDAVLGERLRDTGYFNHAFLEHLVSAHQSGARDYSSPLWSLLMFEAFLRNISAASESGAMRSSLAEHDLVV
jgi:asparagine synthase (glutamine-hydrolysing)